MSVLLPICQLITIIPILFLYFGLNHKIKIMYVISVTPPKFNSNIYVYRSNLSKWLTEYVDIRNNIGTYVMNPDNIHQIDKWLKKYHYEFLKIKKNIELIERDVEIFGS